jgi:hypothetical protein
MMKPAPRPRVLAAVWLLEGVFLLAAAEVLVAATGLDLKLLAPLLYYQGADLPVHEVSGDVALHYALRPGAKASFDGGRTVAINSLGFRDAERRSEKAPGKFRIVCLGASNTYGAAVSDGETYPAQLEKELNRGRPGRFEVWNEGVSAYVLSQNAVDARKAVERDSPDLLIFQVSNCGRRPFLLHAPYARFFREDPDLYAENLVFPEKSPWWHAALMRRSGFYRALLIAWNRRSMKPTDNACVARNDDFNFDAFRDFYAATKGRVPSVLLFHPGQGVDPRLAALGLPAIDLTRELPAGSGAEFMKIHPPAPVYAWYAKAIAAELRRDGLVPR